MKLGIKNALNIFYNLRIRKRNTIRLGHLGAPLQMRSGNESDLATFKEVIVRKDYDFGFAGNPKAIIDGGANIGLTSVFFANKYPSAVIVSIEPDSDNFRYLRQNTSAYPMVKPLHSAIWSSKAFLVIVDHGRGTDGYTVEVAREDRENKFPAISIKDIMDQNGWDTIDILKLDIEGSEKEVFTNGYEAWLPKTKVLIVETHDRFVEGASRAVFAATSRYNFSCSIKGFNMIFVNQDL